MTVVNLSTNKYYPLSFSQSRLWFLAQLEPGNIAYNVSIMYRLQGALDRATLRRAFQEVVNRHEILRTTFVNTQDGPKQCVTPSTECPIRFLNAVKKKQKDVQAIVDNETRNIAYRPYDLSQGPLLRVALIKTGAEEHTLHIAMHHIVTDGWSSRLFIKELADLYTAFIQGNRSPLKPLPIQYGDFAVLQREKFQDKAMNQHLKYWRQRLDNLEQVKLPTNKLPPINQTFEAGNINLTMSADLTAGLKVLANSNSVTLFMVLITGLMTLLGRYSRQYDVVVGTPIAGRTDLNLETLIGFFVNSIALRGDLSGNPTFHELIQRVRDETLLAYSHQDLPFEKLVEELRVERDPRRNPIFQVFFAFQNLNLPHFHYKFGDIQVEQLPMQRDTVATDMDIYIWEESNSLQGAFVYKKDLFEPATIKQFADHYIRILEAFVSDPSQPVLQIPLLNQDERDKVLVEWNTTEKSYPFGTTVQKLVEAQVDRTPDAIAVAFKEQTLTYRELNKKANQLAHYLRVLGVSTEVLVGLCVERSPEMVIGILGILKAGGAYVPLDPSYPKERLRFMLEDTQTPVLLTQSSLYDSLPDYSGQIVTLDADRKLISDQDSSNPAHEVSASNLAYVIYTSGSTGKPKGVEIQHGGLVNLIAWHERTYRVTPKDRASQVAAISFDASVWEMWPYLTAGASIHFPNEDTRLIPVELQKWLLKHGITMCFLPTPMAEVMLTMEWPENVPLRFLLTGGDNLRRRHWKEFPFRVVNHYGPTESTVVATSSEVHTNIEEGMPPCIGRPIANTKIYLFDEYCQLVPIGVVGEVYIEGIGLARSYLNKPKLTAERFIRHRFSDNKEVRLYRTGDLARYRVDGNLEFIGRSDRQIKLRGFRIELGEIEGELLSCPSVRQVVVDVCISKNDDKSLIAYFVTDSKSSVTDKELRSFLMQRLPEYMIPATFIHLEALPLTQNGKVDREALPKPESVYNSLTNIVEAVGKQRLDDSGTVSERNELEMIERMVEVWKDVLKVDRFNANYNFFQHGGHSLLAVELISKVESIFGERLPIKTLFEAPTARELVAKLRNRRSDVTHFTLSPVKPYCSTPPIFLVHGLFLYRELAYCLGSEQPTYGIYIEEEVNTHGSGEPQMTLPFMTVEKLASRYMQEIRSIRPNGPYQLGGESFGGIVAFEIAKQLLKEGEKVTLLALFDTYAPGLLNTTHFRRLRNHLGKIVALGEPYMRRVLTKREVSSLENSSEKKRGPKGKIVAGSYLRREVYRKYEPTPYRGQIVIFKAMDQARKNIPNDLGWGAYATKGVIVYKTPGDHLGILKKPNVNVMAKKLEEHLEGVRDNLEPEVKQTTP